MLSESVANVVDSESLKERVMNRWWYCFVIFLWIGKGTAQIPVIKIPPVAQESIALSDIAECVVREVRLEQVEDVWLSSVRRMMVDGKNLFLRDYRQGQVFRFDVSGKFLNRIGQIGHGPNEYLYLKAFCVDPDLKQIYLMTEKGIKSYDYEGNVKDEYSCIRSLSSGSLCCREGLLYALGEEFGFPPGTLVTGKMVYALRELGFDYVFDTDFAADLTIMEEGSEILNRLTRYLNGDKSIRLPILTSCCPAWVNFFEHHFPDMLDIPSTARSPQQMFGSIAKSYWAEKMGIPREKLVVVSIMPCLAKKYECVRDEFKVNGIPDVDYSISTRELARLIKRANIGFPLVLDSPFDNPMGESTGAGVIFGTTGGVMEAALRSVYEIYTGEPLQNVNFEQVRGLNGVRRATINLNGFELKVGIAHGLGNARHLLEDIRNGHNEYHVIEIMACPGGCIGGGGQPLHHGNSEVLYARANALYREDANKPLRKSHDNPYIKKLYEEYLGKPLSGISETLLHTHYFNKSMD